MGSGVAEKWNDGVSVRDEPQAFAPPFSGLDAGAFAIEPAAMELDERRVLLVTELVAPGLELRGEADLRGREGGATREGATRVGSWRRHTPRIAPGLLS